MQKNLFWLSLLAAVMGVGTWSCSDDADAALKLSSTSCAFSAQGGEKSIVVATDKKTWTVSKVEGEWYSTTQSDGLLIVVAPVNNTDEIRKGLLAVTAGNVTTHIEIKQEAAGSHTDGLAIYPAGNSFNASYEAGSMVFTVYAGGEWNAESSEEWLDAQPDKDKGLLILSWDDNAENVAKTSDVTVTSGDNKIKFTVSQNTGAVDP